MTGTIMLAVMVLVIMTVGEVWRIDAPGVEREVPLAQATGVALAAGTTWPEFIPGMPESGLVWVLLLVTAATLIGRQVRVHLNELTRPIARFRKGNRPRRTREEWEAAVERSGTVKQSVAWSTGSVLIAGVLTRIPGPGGVSLLSMLTDRRLEPWEASLATVAVVGVAVFVPILWPAVVQSVSDRGVGGAPLRVRVVQEVKTHGMLALATITTGVVIAFSLSMLDAGAFLIAMFPLAVIIPTMKKHHESRVAQGQTIRALSQMTDVAGLTVPGHAARVADLSVRLAREMGERDSDLGTIELAALLHDLGQIVLRRPIPGGATSDVSAADQRRVAALSASVLSRTPDLSNVSVMVTDAGLQHAHVNGRPEVSLGSRIVRVASTYDDLTHGLDAEGVVVGLERMIRLVPEDLDPVVVGFLIRHLTRRKVVGAEDEKRLLGQLEAVTAGG